MAWATTAASATIAARATTAASATTAAREQRRRGAGGRLRGLVVFDFYEEEATGGCGGASGGAVTSGEDFWDGVRRDAAQGALDEGTYEVADHVVQEAGAGDAVGEEVFVLGPVGEVHGADVGGVEGYLRWFGGGGFAGGEVGVGGGEAGEVVGAEDVVGG